MIQYQEIKINGDSVYISGIANFCKDTRYNLKISPNWYFFVSFFFHCNSDAYHILWIANSSNRKSWQAQAKKKKERKKHFHTFIHMHGMSKAYNFKVAPTKMHPLSLDLRNSYIALRFAVLFGVHYFFEYKQHNPSCISTKIYLTVNISSYTYRNSWILSR